MSLAVFTLVTTWALYARGLLADAHQFYGVAVFGAAAYLLLTWRWPRLPRDDWRTWALLAFLGGHILPLLWAAHRSHGVLGALLSVALWGVYLLGYRLADWPGAKFWLSTALSGLAAAVSFFGILVLAGKAEFPAAYMTGMVRLGSTLQYPNVFAALAGAGILAGLALPRPEGMVGWRQPFLFLNALGLFLSGSRAGLAVTAVALAGFALATVRRHPRLPLVAAVHLGAATLVFARIRGVLQEPPEPRVLTLALAGLAAATAVGLALDWGLRRLPRWVAWGLLGVGAVGVVALVPSTLYRLLPSLARLGTDASSLGRFANLVDAARAFLRYPFGLGYMGWGSVYRSLQQYGYSINIAHSHPAEVAVAAGILGLLGLGGIWAGVAWSYWRLSRAQESRPAEGTGVAAGEAAGGHPPHALFWALVLLGLHSLVDADFHFLGVFFPVALAWGFMHGLAPGRGGVRLVTPSRFGRQALVALSLVLGVSSLTLGLGANRADQAEGLLGQQAYQQAIRRAALAQRLNPFDPDGFAVEAAALQALVKAGEVEEDEALERISRLLQKAVALDRFSSIYWGNLGAFLASQGVLDQAEEYLRKAVRLAPWDVRAWEEWLDFHVQAARAYRDAGRSQEMQVHLEKARQVLRELEEQKGREPAHTPEVFQMNIKTERLERLRQELADLSQS
ncbi:MAG: O-antigen ligase family protein [Firmicutes bacterium]|nr:O-antigen ligase family protein [Bacillota bacterium]